jgi:hypothetical protein
MALVWAVAGEPGEQALHRAREMADTRAGALREEQREQRRQQGEANQVEPLG